MKDEGCPERLRILVSDWQGHRLDEVLHSVTVLGHEVVGQTALGEVAAASASVRADAAIVIVGEGTERALELIGRIVTEAACPVIAILEVQDRAFIDKAARIGIFSSIAHAGDLEEMQSSMDIALQRFAEYHALQGAFERRAVTERAKGILMERGSLDEQRAFHLLREHARRTNRKVVDVAGSILESHRLLSNGSEPIVLDNELLVRTEDGG
jgi:AmiR/NasT family two-component response regulator